MTCPAVRIITELLSILASEMCCINHFASRGSFFGKKPFYQYSEVEWWCVYQWNRKVKPRTFRHPLVLAFILYHFWDHIWWLTFVLQNHRSAPGFGCRPGQDCMEAQQLPQQQVSILYPVIVAQRKCRVSYTSIITDVAQIRGKTYLA